MDPILTLVTVFAVFIPALLLPGPDFVAVVRSAMARGARAGLLTTVGVTLGLSFYASLSLLGLSAILVEHQWLTWAVRLLGGCYLVVLGIRLLLASAQKIEAVETTAPEHGGALLFGFLVTLTNPKAIVLFASVFATAVTAATPSWLMALIIGLVAACSLVWYGCVVVFLASPPVLRRFRRARHWIERAAGVCFIGFGSKVMASARGPVAP